MRMGVSFKRNFLNRFYYKRIDFECQDLGLVNREVSGVIIANKNTKKEENQLTAGDS